MISEHVLKEMVKQAGGVYVGIQEGVGESLVLFNDPQTESTVAVDLRDISIAKIYTKLLKSRIKFFPSYKTPINSDLCLEIDEIYKMVRELLPFVALDARAIEKLMNVLARITVLQHYVKTRYHDSKE